MSHTAKQTKTQIGLLALGALGVVYGDIGTSPLYAISEIFFGGSQLTFTPENILGCISLVLWALTLIVVVKYIVFVLRADSDGEGGVFALFSLLKQHEDKIGVGALIILLTLAAGLLFGDGLITPAISVLSAVEGLAVAAPKLGELVVPITVAILTALFFIQKKGTAKVGLVFGPIVCVWFLMIAWLGLRQIMIHPEILAAINPLYALSFLHQVEFSKILFVLGAVILVVTGGEALYADMGHFGKLPIRLSWFLMVYPCLALCYLGQGAFLLGGGEILNGNIFYSMVPADMIYFVIIIATMATIIASQALISGAFSLVSQAVALGVLPRMKIVHTHEDHQGQLYVPFINWSLWLGCIILVIIFESSKALASAYGLAVAGDMLVNSLSMLALSYYVWRWSIWRAVGLFGVFALVDASFLGANSIKFLEGGFIPLSVGLVVFVIMRTWQWGRNKTNEVFSQYRSIQIKDLVEVRAGLDNLIDKSIVFMTASKIDNLEDKVPPLVRIFLNRLDTLPKNIIMLNVEELNVPYCHGERYLVKSFWSNNGSGSITGVTVRFGFMEEPDVESVLEGLAAHKQINIDEHPKNWIMHVVKTRILSDIGISWLNKLRVNLYRFLLKNSDAIDKYFGLGNEVSLSIDVIPVRVK